MILFKDDIDDCTMLQDIKYLKRTKDDKKACYDSLKPFLFHLSERYDRLQRYNEELTRNPDHLMWRGVLDVGKSN